MMSLADRKERLVRRVDELAPAWREIALKMHAHPELAGEEHLACRWMSEALESSGFRTERGLAGMPTSFAARRGTNADAPLVAFMAEMDALPEVGHACGHNLSGPASCLAAVALAESEGDAAVRLVVFGSPGEEKSEVGGKATLMEHGLLKDVAAAMMAHGGFMNLPNRDMLARRTIRAEFRGQASGPPPAGTGPDALESLLVLLSAATAMRSKFRPRTRLDMAILDAGSESGGRTEAALARAEFVLRATNLPYLDDLERRLRGSAEAAAALTGATLDWSSQTGRYLPMKRNPALEAAYEANLRLLGEEVGVFPLEESIGFTDQGTISQQVPAIHPYFKMVCRGVKHHTKEFAEADASEAGLAGMISAAKAMALTALDLTASPALATAVRADFVSDS